MSTAGVVDYRVRAAKQIERRMIGETLSLLNRLQNVSSYQYFGMGSISFVDFALVHKVLGISKMISIEHEKHVERVRFNAPYKCVEIKEGNSHSVLPEIDFAPPTIGWLDYDGKINEKILDDVALCMQRMQVGSVLMVTLNAESGGHPNQMKAELAELKRGLKASRFHAKVTPATLEKWGYAKFLQFITSREIQSQERDRNRLKKDVEKVVARQFLNFVYRDGARMCTIGWFLDWAAEEKSLAKQCRFSDLSWFRDSAAPFLIAPPVLTPHEVRSLNKQLPVADLASVLSPGLPAEEIKQFSQLYRYFPLYFEVTEA